MQILSTSTYKLEVYTKHKDNKSSSKCRNVFCGAGSSSSSHTSKIKECLSGASSSKHLGTSGQLFFYGHHSLGLFFPALPPLLSEFRPAGSPAVPGPFRRQEEKHIHRYALLTWNICITLNLAREFMKSILVFPRGCWTLIRLRSSSTEIFPRKFLHPLLKSRPML